MSSDRTNFDMEKFCPGTGLLTTSKKFPGCLPGGCSRLELIDALTSRFQAEPGRDLVLVYFCIFQAYFSRECIISYTTENWYQTYRI